MMRTSNRQSKAKILAIYNNDLRDSVENLLSKDGYKVSVASSVAEAIVKFKGRETVPDLALIDIRLTASMNGSETAGKIKDHFNIPVVYTSPPSASREKTKIIGSSGNLPNPLSSEELRKAIEDQLDWQRLEAERLHSSQLAALGVMASGLAHEIAQPLQLILAISQNCNREIQRNAIDTEGILKDLNQIAATTGRIDRIVNHLHVLSRERKPKLEAVDINTVIENSFIMFHHQLKSRGIEIKQNFSENLPPIKADAIQLEQVFINLISNARDALEGVEDKTITISTEAVSGYIRVEFHDNGAGITPDDLPKIFEPFFTTKEGGMGLGLHISHDIIEFYNGTITVQSDINEGTTFIIQLPIAKKEDLE